MGVAEGVARPVDSDGVGRDAFASPGEVAWLTLLPALMLAVPLVALLAAPLGDVAFPLPPYTFWDPGPVVRKPAVQAGYVLTAAFAIAYALAVDLLVRRGVRLRRPLRRALVATIQAALAALVVVCWVAQGEIEYEGIGRVYFTAATLVTAALLALLAWWLARTRSAAALAARLGQRMRDSRGAWLAGLALAALLTAVWLLPTVYTDRGVAFGPGELTGNAYAFDEASAVVNGRSPLVDMVAYGTLWSYVVALPLAALDNGYAAFTVTMALLTGLGLLAVYGVLRRVTGSTLAALALYVPVLASSFFIETGTLVARYDPGNYFGIFPLRYTGPYLLAWLVARHADPRAMRRVPLELLFAVAGLVALNNVDFGCSALAATVLAVLAVRRPEEGLRRLARGAAVGLGAALVLVSLLTLLRAGSLPHLGLLLRYGRIFVSGGYGNVALPGLGLHVAITLTFVAALASAAVRHAVARENPVLTAMLAWCGVFGLGASTYFYAYRSHPDVLINLFSIWSLTLALLVVAVAAELRRAGAPRLPTLPQLAVLFGFGLMVCSVAQLPLPWQQRDRIEASSPYEPFRLPGLTAVVGATTRPGERVVVFAPVGHRVAEAAGVVNVSPYTGLGQMPAREQLDEVLDLLRSEGGTKLYVAEAAPAELDGELANRGYAGLGRWPGIGSEGSPVVLYQARSAQR